MCRLGVRKPGFWFWFLSVTSTITKRVTVDRLQELNANYLFGVHDVVLPGDQMPAPNTQSTSGFSVSENDLPNKDRASVVKRDWKLEVDEEIFR